MPSVARAQDGFNWRRLQNVWRFSAGMGLVAVSAIILMQVDKAILSKLLDLEKFGQYMLAVVVAGGLYLVLRPVFSVIYPRMSMLVANNQIAELTEFYRFGTRLLCTLLFPIAATIAMFSTELVQLWTQNSATAAQVGPLVSILLIGTALNVVMHFPYALQLAYGVSSLPLQINSILVVAFIPLTIVLTHRYGAVGGAAAWAILNVLYLLLGTWLTHQRLLPGLGARWLSHDVLIPLVVSLLIIVGGGLLLKSAGFFYLLDLICAVLLGLTAVGINLLLTQEVVPRLRRALA